MVLLSDFFPSKGMQRMFRLNWKDWGTASLLQRKKNFERKSGYWFQGWNQKPNLLVIGSKFNCPDPIFGREKNSVKRLHMGCNSPKMPPLNKTPRYLKRLWGSCRRGSRVAKGIRL